MIPFSVAQITASTAQVDTEDIHQIMLDHCVLERVQQNTIAVNALHNIVRKVRICCREVLIAAHHIAVAVELRAIPLFTHRLSVGPRSTPVNAAAANVLHGTIGNLPIIKLGRNLILCIVYLCLEPIDHAAKHLALVAGFTAETLNVHVEGPHPYRNLWATVDLLRYTRT